MTNTHSDAFDVGTVRRRNLALVLAELRSGGSSTRARVAARTGMSRGSVASLVAELEDRGLVRVGDPRRAGDVGRPGNAIRLVPGRVLSLGLAVTSHYLQVVVVDLAGNVLVSDRRPTGSQPAEPEIAIDVLTSMATDVLDGSMAGRETNALLGGVGVAIPGLVDPGRGLVRQLTGTAWKDVPLERTLRDRLPPTLCGIRVDSAATLGALAEQRFADRPIQNLVYLTGSGDMEAGFIIAGQPYRGATGSAGEVGHNPIPGGQLPCQCGRRGCWVTEVGLEALLERTSDSGDILRDPTVDIDVRAGIIANRARSGDTRVIAALDHVADRLAVGLAPLVNTINPEVVVLAGYVSRLAEFLLEPIRARLSEHVVADDRGGCEVLPSRLGPDGAVIGAAVSAIEPLANDPAMVPARA